MSNRFSAKMRIQPTPRVCHSTDCGPRVIPISVSSLAGVFWWNGYDVDSTPVNFARRFYFPHFVPPSYNTQTDLPFGPRFFRFFFSTDATFRTWNVFIELYESANLIGLLTQQATNEQPRDPFDTGPRKLIMLLGSGNAGFRIMR